MATLNADAGGFALKTVFDSQIQNSCNFETNFLYLRQKITRSIAYHKNKQIERAQKPTESACTKKKQKTVATAASTFHLLFR